MRIDPEYKLDFDDVLIRPGLSEMLPNDVDIRSRITRSSMYSTRRCGSSNGLRRT